MQCSRPRFAILVCLLVCLLIESFYADSIPLTLGQPTPFILQSQADTYSYYQLDLPSSISKGINFILTPLSGGDSDLFVSVSNPQPQAGSADFSSTSSNGVEYIYINSTDPKFKATGSYYISVWSHKTPVAYTLVAQVEDAPIQMTLGTPQFGTVEKDNYRYFKVDIIDAGYFIISSTDIYGDSDIYVSTATDKPSKTNYEWRHSYAGSDVLQINKPNITPTTYYIAIYGSRDSAYQLAVYNSLTSVQLSANLALRSELNARSYQFFKFYISYATGFTVRLQRISYFGDPNIYISSITENPTSTNYTWKSERTAIDESIRIEANDPNIQTGYLYLGVYDNSRFATTFQLTIALDGSHTILENSQTVSISTPAGKIDYFKYKYVEPAIASTAELALTLESGSAQLFLSKTATNPFPSSTQYDFLGVDNGNGLISYSISSPVNGAWYYIGVQALNDQSANYTFVITTAADSISLLPDRVYSFSISRDTYRYFVFEYEDLSRDVYFALRASNGDPDLYISITENPSASHFEWSSRSTASIDSQLITSDDPNLKKPEFQNKLYLGVHGYSAATFTLVAHISNTTLTLDNGIPVAGIVLRAKYNYYRYYMSQTGRLTFTLRHIGGTRATNDADLYVSRKVIRPDSSNFEYRATSWGDDFLSVDASPGWYYIGIYGYSSPSANYTLEVSADSGFLTADGFGFFDSVSQGTYRYYNTFIDANDQTSEVIATVTLVSGKTSLFALNNASKPTTELNIAADTSFSGNVLKITKEMVSNLGGRYTFGVFGDLDSTYFIHIAYGTKPNYYQSLLKDGKPVTGTASGLTYFSLTESLETNKDYFVNLRLLGRPESTTSTLKLYLGTELNSFPTDSTNRMKKETVNDLFFKVPQYILNGATALVAGIESSVASYKYMLQIAKEGSPVYLTQFQPIEVITSIDETGYFQVYSPRNAKQLLIEMDSCSDGPAPLFYASATNARPKEAPDRIVSQINGKFTQSASTTQQIRLDATIFIETDTITVGEKKYTVFATTVNDQRPTLSDAKITQGEQTDTTVKLSFKKPSSIATKATYMVYRRRINPGEFREYVNMDTVCAVESAELQLEISDCTADECTATVNIGRYEVSIFNVIVMDDYGNKRAYSPFYYNMGTDDVLSVGIKSNGFVGENSAVHMTLSNFTGLVSDQQTLVFSLLAYIGEVDLYISTSGYPTKDTAMWKSENGGFDIISIKRSDPNYKPNGPYYLTIFGEEQSKFGLLAYIDGDAAQPIVLQNGDLIVATTSRSQYTNFVYHLDNNEGLTATVSPLGGDPDLYVSTERPPTRYDHTWSSDLNSVEVVSIANTDPYYKAQSDYLISIYGWKESTYTIGVTKGNTNQLVAEGIPMQGIVKANQLQYYMFDHIFDEDITISVTVLNAIEEESDPDLFVSTSVKSPDSRQSDWRSTNVGGDAITISKNDPKFIMGTYYIGVRGYLRDAKYQIVVESENQNTLLLDGIPQQGNVVRGGKLEYFKFYYGYQEDNLLFQATALHSTMVGLYVSKVTSKPSAAKSEYPMEREGSTTFVRIEKGAPIGWYYLAVDSISPSANYSLVVQTEQTALILQNGRILTKNHVPRGYYRYFSFDISNIQDNKQHLVIAVNSEYGDPDIYVSYRFRRPSTSEYDFKKDTFGGDTVSVELSQLPSNVTTIFIGVYGFSSSRFSIVGYLSSTIVEVEEGEPISGRVTPNEYGHFQFTLTNPGRLRFNLKITESYPANAHLYVSTTNQFPNAANYDYASTNYGDDFIVIEDAPPTTYYISVHGQRFTTGFLLSVSTEFQYIDDNYSILDFQRKGQFRYFKAYVSNYARFVFASVTVINGLTALYVSTNETLPTEQYYDYSSHSWPGNALMKYSTDAKFRPGIWTFGVLAIEDSDFYMSVGTHEVALSAGQPKVGIVRIGKPVFFVYRTASHINSNADMLLSLKGYNPNNQVVAYISQVTTRPDKSNNTYSIVSDLFLDNQGFLTLKAADIQPNQHLYIGVYGYASEDNTFEVTVASEENPVYITQEFHNLYQFKSTYNYFAMFTGKAAQHLQFFVYSCTADRVDSNQMVVYGSANQSVDAYPDATTYQFKSNVLTPFSLGIATDTIAAKSKIMFNLQSTNAKQLAMQQFHFSIYTTTDPEDPRPFAPTRSPLTVSYVQTEPAVPPAPSLDVFSITIPGADTRRTTVKQFIYQIVAVPYTEGVNAYTLCGIKTHVDVKFYEKIVAPVGKQQIVGKIYIEAGSEYMVNVIVTDDLELENMPYEPIRVKYTGNRNNVDLSFFSPLSVGFFLLLFIFIGIILYIVIGIIVQLARKKRGVEVIPNLSFWKDLPYLIYDGILLLTIPCRKRGKNWNRLHEEYPEVDVEIITS